MPLTDMILVPAPAAAIRRLLLLVPVPGAPIYTPKLLAPDVMESTNRPEALVITELAPLIGLVAWKPTTFTQVKEAAVVAGCAKNEEISLVAALEPVC